MPIDNYIARLGHYIDISKNKIYTKLDKHSSIIISKDSLCIFAGFASALGLYGLEGILNSSGVDFGVPREVSRGIALGIPSYPILKGAYENLKTYFSPKKILKFIGPHEPKSTYMLSTMLTAGVALHFAGEYAQLVAIAIGGDDFRSTFAARNVSQFIGDPTAFHIGFSMCPDSF